MNVNKTYGSLYNIIGVEIQIFFKLQHGKYFYVVLNFFDQNFQFLWNILIKTFVCVLNRRIRKRVRYGITFSDTLWFD